MFRTGLRLVALLALMAVVCMPRLVMAQVGFDPRYETMARLAKPITVDFKDARLGDVMEFLQTVSQVDIEPMWIDDQYTDGLDKDQSVSVAARNIAVLSVIERVLDKVQTDFDGNTWQLSDTGALEVGPKSRLNKEKRLQIYDIQDLLFQVNNYAEVPQLDLDAAIQQGGQGGGGGGGSIFEDNSNDTATQPSQEDQAKQLIDIIIEFVEPEQWRDNGGDGGTITYYRGTFLIRAPDYIHRQLGGYSFWPGTLARTASARADQYARAEARAEKALRDEAAQTRATRTAQPESAESPAQK